MNRKKLSFNNILFVFYLGIFYNLLCEHKFCFVVEEVYVKWRGCFMYPEVIKKMAFSKEHRDLLLKLYNKEITRREYDRLVESLYRPSKEVCEG